MKISALVGWEEVIIKEISNGYEYMVGESLLLPEYPNYYKIIKNIEDLEKIKEDISPGAVFKLTQGKELNREEWVDFLKSTLFSNNSNN